MAVDTIIDNANNINYFDETGNIVGKGVPKNLDEFSSAIAQTKTKIFDEYSALAQQAGKQGAVVDLTDVADELLKLSDEKVIKDFSPALAKTAEQTAETLLDRGFYTVDEADDVIRTLNNRLKSFYKTGTIAPGTSAEVDALVRNQIASKLDNVINNAIKGSAGESFQQLKNRYGALREIEPSVNKALFGQMKKQKQGIIDLTDVFSASDIITGTLVGSPTLVTKGVLIKTGKEIFKGLRDPNIAVKNAFSTMEKIKTGNIKIPLGKTRVIGATAPQAKRQVEQ